MAGLHLDGGMGTLGTAAFGSGFMRGMDKARRHRREDEQDARAEQTHGLHLRQGEQSYAQREQLFPEQLTQAKNTNAIGGLKLQGAQRTERFAEADEAALSQAQQYLINQASGAAQQAYDGDFDGINQINADITARTGHPTPVYAPASRNTIGIFDINDTSNPIQEFANTREASEFWLNNAREFYKVNSPTVLQKLLTQEDEGLQQDWRGLGNSGYAIDAKSGRTKKVFDPEPKGARAGGSGGGLKYSDENTMNRWVEGYYGKRDAMGQFVLTEEQKYQAVEAQERAIAMLNANPDLTMSQAYQIAVGSVSGKIPLSKAEELAALEAEEQGIPKNIKGALGGNNPNPEYNEFIKSRAQEIVNTGQEEADYLYRQIAGMPQQAMQVPQQNEVPQATSNQPIQINSKEEFDRLPIGTQFIAPDGSVRIK